MKDWKTKTLPDDGQAFVQICIQDGKLNVGRENTVAARSRPISLSEREFSDGGTRYSIDRLWPCEPGSLAPSGLFGYPESYSSFVYALVEDIKDATEQMVREFTAGMQLQQARLLQNQKDVVRILEDAVKTKAVRTGSWSATQKDIKNFEAKQAAEKAEQEREDRSRFVSKQLFSFTWEQETFDIPAGLPCDRIEAYNPQRPSKFWLRGKPPDLPDYLLYKFRRNGIILERDQVDFDGAPS